MEESMPSYIPRTQDLGASHSALHQQLLAWYDRHARRLPWRALPGQQPDPYRVWLSEIMLQQTTVATVGPYFETFLARWPRLEVLAAAPLDDVLTVWAGLGYYARARNLHRCAHVLVEKYGGKFPREEAALRELPRIGPYPAAAIAAIAFDQPAAPVDGIWERVVARLFAIRTPLPAAKPAIRKAAASLMPQRRPGDFAQAVMDLGATVCQPGRPKCLLCPVAEFCAVGEPDMAAPLPLKSPKSEKPTRRGVAFWITDVQRRLLLRRRPERGLLGGMMEVPSTEWREDGWAEAEAQLHAPLFADWRPLPGRVRHTFTHFHLELELWAGQGEGEVPEGRWVTLDALGEQALPSVMRKVVAHALKNGG